MTGFVGETVRHLDAQRDAFLATAVGDIPTIAPVSFARDGSTLVVAVRQGRLLEQIHQNPSIQLQVDALRVSGRATEITDPGEQESARLLLPEKECFVRIRPITIENGDGQVEELRENESAPLMDAAVRLLLRLALFIRAVRAPFFTATMVPMALGFLLAIRDGANWNTAQAIWAALALLCAHAGTNLANDYFDHRTRNDDRNENFTKVNGGNRLIQLGLWSADQTLVVALVAWVACTGIGLFLLEMPRQLVLTLGLTGFGLGFFYSGWPFRLAYRGFGDLAVAIGFGPVVTGGSYAVLSGSWSWTAALASTPIAIAVAMILFINSFQDADADALANKRTSVVRIGSKRRAFQIFTAAWVLVYLSIVLLVVSRILPVWALIALLTIPLAIRAVRMGKEKTEEIQALLPVNFATIGLHLMVGLLLALGVFLETVI